VRPLWGVDARHQGQDRQAEESVTHTR